MSAADEARLEKMRAHGDLLRSASRIVEAMDVVAPKYFSLRQKDETGSQYLQVKTEGVLR
ncbi:hypothetical protein RJO15_13040 [Herbaspirillum huttiense F1]|uniref:hypothetical protein n=1 Tax=Herbaspirillum huttiense TaxID=863372 RepID=UPI000EAE0957|nr:hypothetical protein [Herbaspirillum huttiense]MDT0356702.1 hypothetical protein [Herbaspirillum huttiense F1]